LVFLDFTKSPKVVDQKNGVSSRGAVIVEQADTARDGES
jgi:hypothetical protein